MDRTEFGNRKKQSNMDMEIDNTTLLHQMRTFLEKSGKLKYAILLAAIGIFLLLLPEKSPAAPAVTLTEITAVAEPTVEERIAAILSQMDNAGRVEVMLTIKNEGEIIYQTDTEERIAENSADIRTETVFGASSEKGGALIRQRNAPEYLGALVLAQGGDLPDVQYRIKLAVSGLTGLGTDKITVLKMK